MDPRGTDELRWPLSRGAGGSSLEKGKLCRDLGLWAISSLSELPQGVGSGF